MSSDQAIHPDRIANIPSSSKKKKKKPKPIKPQPASTSLNRGQLRKKIRDITRLLNASSAASSGSGSAPANHKLSKLSATSRLEHERALAAYKHELSTQQLSEKSQTLEKRYHKVRFFERRKATRALSRLKRQLEICDQEEEKGVEKEDLQRKVHEAEVDLNYIMHYPGLEKYISLYKGGDNKETNGKREQIRKDVERKMEEGTLHKGEALTLANAADGFGDSSKKSTRKNIAKESKTKDDEENEDDASDGGFFEF